METSAPVAKAAVEAPRWSEAGHGVFRWARLAHGGRESAGGRSGSGTRCTAAASITAAAASRCRRSPRSISPYGTSCGKFYGQPVCMLLGAQMARHACGPMPARCSGPRPKHARGARRYLDAGLHAPSNSAGAFSARTRAGTCELVEAARSEMGDRNDLLIDTGWFVERTPKQAIQVIRSLEPYRAVLHRRDPASRKITTVTGRSRSRGHAHRVRRAGSHRVGFPRTDRARAESISCSPTSPAAADSRWHARSSTWPSARTFW